MPSFTVELPNLLQAGPILEVGIAVPSIVEESLRKAGQSIPMPIKTIAMIDPGATVTVFREDMVQQLNLRPVGTTLINTPSSTNVQCYEYFVRLLFPNNVIVETLGISVSLQGQHITCLVGRDILQHGVFIYTGYHNSFTLCF